MKKKRICSVEGCDGERVGKGLCPKHYLKAKKYNGDPLGGRSNEKGGICTIEGCEEKTHGKGLCNKHYWEEYRKTESSKKNLEKYYKSEKGMELSRKKAQKRRALKRGVAVENFAPTEVFEENNWICGLCGKPVNKRLKHPNPRSPSLDHIKPLSKGGTHTRDNVQLAHLRCNLVKGNRVP